MNTYKNTHTCKDAKRLWPDANRLRSVNSQRYMSDIYLFTPAFWLDLEIEPDPLASCFHSQSCLWHKNTHTWSDAKWLWSDANRLRSDVNRLRSINSLITPGETVLSLGRVLPFGTHSPSIEKVDFLQHIQEPTQKPSLLIQLLHLLFFF